VATSGATGLVRERTWSFQGGRGTVKIRASEYGPGVGMKHHTALDLWVEDGRSEIEEDGRFLSLVLTELPNSGFDISSISILLFRLDQTDAPERIAPFAAESKQWNSIARAHSASITYPAVTAMLNQSNVFQDWFSIFRAHGLEGDVAGIEKLGMTTFRETGAACPAKLNCNRVLVPATALVQVNLHSIQKTEAKPAQSE
jgi:hypothetical protein